MGGTEKVMLCRVCLFEAGMRLCQDIEDDPERQQKYDLVIVMCREIENHESYMSEKTRLFIPEDLSRAALKEGYICSSAYNWLKDNGTLEGHFEMKTVLHENYEQMMTRLQAMTQRYNAARMGVELVQQQR